MGSILKEPCELNCLFFFLVFLVFAFSCLFFWVEGGGRSRMGWIGELMEC